MSPGTTGPQRPRALPVPSRQLSLVRPADHPAAASAPSPERWLAIHLPDLPLELYGRGLAEDVPLAVSRQQGGARILLCNGRAAAGGVRPGMQVSAAYALVAGLRVLPHRAEEERRLLERIGAWCGQFTPLVSLEPPRSLVLEVGRSLSLFKGASALLQRVADGVRELGYEARLCLAPTPQGALILAAHGSSSRVDDLPALRAAVAALPLPALGLETRWLGDLWDMGLRRVGDLLRLPRSGLAERLGPEQVLRLDRILGAEPDPRPPFRPPPRFSSRLELPSEVAQADRLAFAGRRLLLELGGYLLGRGAGVQRLEWSLRHPLQPPTRFTLGLASPERDPEHLAGLLRERLSRLVLREPVREMALRARDIQPLDAQPLELFPDRRQVQRETGQRFVDRLRARLGREAVQGLGLVSDHRPERAWTYVDPGGGETGRGRPNRPLWLLPAPEALEVRQGRPYRGGRLEFVGERERIESGWWDGQGVARDYFVVLTPAGERLWVFRDCRGDQGWFVHGLFG